MSRINMRSHCFKKIKCIVFLAIFLPVTFPSPVKVFLQNSLALAPFTSLFEEELSPTEPRLAPDARKIVMISPELDNPFFKAGGMGDYMHGLSVALREEGQEVIVISCLYQRDGKDSERIKRGEKTKKESLIEQFQMKKVPGPLHFKIGEETVRVEVMTCRHEGITYYFLVQDQYADQLYRFRNNLDRIKKAIFLSRGSLELLTSLGISPDIIHTNDWMTALVPTFLKTDPKYGKDPHLRQLRTVHTLHNSGRAYQGIFPFREDGKDFYSLLNLSGEHFFGLSYFSYDFWKQHPDQIGNHKLAETWLKSAREPTKLWELNLTAAAVGLHADQIVTVSEKFRRETLTHEYAEGIELLLELRGEKGFRGIVNGIDHAYWVRALDKMGGKEKARDKLLEVTSLRRDIEGPILGMVGRITEQKGLGLVAEQMETLLSERPELRFVYTGKAEEEDHQGKSWERVLQDLVKKFPGRVYFKNEFNPQIAELFFLGCDMFLMPSRYEPCGIAQLNALAVGTVPIVRITGGLDDTVEEFNEVLGQGIGIRFKEYRGDKMVYAVLKALRIYQEDKILWWQLVANARSKAREFTWKNSARKYLHLYREMRGEFIARDEVPPPSPFLYENAKDPNPHTLDEWDRKHYLWDEQEKCWRSKHFTKLILGRAQDVQLNKSGNQLKNHVAIRIKSGWTLYVVDEQKWVVSYLKEAQARGEIPKTGNDQIALDQSADQEFPPTEIPFEADLDGIQNYVEALPDSTSYNTILAEDGFIGRHFWINNHEQITWYAPLAGKVPFFAANREDFFTKMLWRPQKSALITIDTNVDNSPGQILGVLNRLDAEGIIPLSVVLSVSPPRLALDSFLAKKIPLIFSEENLIRSLERKASFPHWELVFQRLFKIYLDQMKEVILTLDQGHYGIQKKTLQFPKVLFEKENLYLVARYLAAKIHNYVITEGAQRINIFMEDKRLEHQLFIKLLEEMENYKPALNDLGNYRKNIEFISSRGIDMPQAENLPQNKGSQEPESLLKKELVSVGIHVTASEIKLVVAQVPDDIILYRNELKIKPEKQTGALLRQQIVELVRQLPQAFREKTNQNLKIDAIGISFSGPIFKRKIIRLPHFEKEWLRQRGSGPSRPLAQDYEELNWLCEQLTQEFGITRIGLLNDAKAHAISEMAKRKMTRRTGTKVVLTLGNGVGFAKIKDGKLEDKPQEAGHLVVRIANPSVVCQACGVMGDLEEYVSERGVVRKAKLLGFKKVGGEITAYDVAQAALQAFEKLKRQEENELEEISHSQGPIELKHFNLSENEILAFQIWNELGEIYADAVAQLIEITGANQFIFAGNLMQGREGKLLRFMIQQNLKTKYPEITQKKENIIVKGKADLVWGSALGVAKYSATLPQGNPDLVGDPRLVSASLDRAI